MDLVSIREVSLDYGISRRMLCYYEEIGLIKSTRKDMYAYRMYDEDAIKRLQQIIILRKLQIPMKQIKDILNNQNAVKIIEIFKQNIYELDEKITALSSVKSILARFIDELQEKADVYLKLDILNDKTMISVVSSLSFSENKISNIKENVSMDELNKASEILKRQNKSQVFTFKAWHDEFLFLGKIYRDKEMDFGKWFDDFSKIGGFEKIKPYKKDISDYCASINVMLPEYWTVGIGIIADKVTEAPEGYELKTFPGGEFFVVTSEWKLTDDAMYPIFWIRCVIQTKINSKLCWQKANKTEQI